MSETSTTATNAIAPSATTPPPTPSRWTPAWITYATMHIGSMIGLVVLVAVHTVTWADVQAPFYGLAGLGIGLPLTLPPQGGRG